MNREIGTAAKPGGYSAGLVARLVACWQDLTGPDGRLPQRRHVLASRRSKDRFGGANYEISASFRVDVEAGLARLPAETQGLLRLRMAGLSAPAMGRRLDVCTSTVYRRMDRSIEELAQAMNNLGGSSVPKTANNGHSGHSHDPDKSLPQPSAGEQAAVDVFTALDRKLERLPAGWTEIRIKRGLRDSYQIAVVYT